MSCIRIISVFFVLLAATYAEKSVFDGVMPWLCLERCNSHSQIQENLSQVHNHVADLGLVSYERYDLRNNATFYTNHFTDITKDMQQDGLYTFPMITTASISRLRALFKNPNKFIADATKEIVRKGYTGYNIDFEPCQRGEICTQEDHDNYVKFLEQFTKSIHKVGKLLTVCVASWNIFLRNFEDISATGVDAVFTMDTYATSLNYFKSHVDKGLEQVGADKLVIGLCSSCTHSPPSVAEMEPKIAYLKEKGIKKVAVWDSPIPDDWWPLLKDFAPQN